MQHVKITQIDLIDYSQPFCSHQGYIKEKKLLAGVRVEIRIRQMEFLMERLLYLFVGSLACN